MAHQRGTTQTARRGLTLFPSKLVLCQEDGPHQLSHWRLNRHKEFLGVSAEKERRPRRRGDLIRQLYFLSRRCGQALLPNTPTAPCLFGGCGALSQSQSRSRSRSRAYHSWKFAACVESQKSMPSTAVAVSPAGSISVDTKTDKGTPFQAAAL